MRVQHKEIRRIVIDDEHPQAAEKLIVPGPPVTRRGTPQLDGELERGTMSWPTCDSDLPSHELHELFHDRQSKPRAAELPCGGSVGLRERGEQPCQRLGGDADAGVGDRAFHRQCSGVLRQEMEPHGDLAAVGEFHSIAHQIQQHLAEPGRIADGSIGNIRRKKTGQVQPFSLSWIGEQINRLFNRLAQLELHLLEFQLPGLDLREIQNTVDDAEKSGAGAVHAVG